MDDLRTEARYDTIICPVDSGYNTKTMPSQLNPSLIYLKYNMPHMTVLSSNTPYPLKNLIYQSNYNRMTCGDIKLPKKKKTLFLYGSCELKQNSNLDNICKLSSLNIVTVLLSEISLRVDADMIFYCLDLIHEYENSINMRDGSNLNTADYISNSIALLRSTSIAAAQASLQYKLKSIQAISGANEMIYMENFYHSNIIIHAEINVDKSVLNRLEESKQMDMSMAVGFAILGGPLISYFSQILLTIAHISPVFQLRSLSLPHYIGSSQVLYMKIIQRLIKQATNQMYFKLFTTMELLGNPSSLFDDINAGIIDLWWITLQEFTGKKALKFDGIKSFALSIVHGSCAVLSKALGTMAEVIKTASDIDPNPTMEESLNGSINLSRSNKTCINAWNNSLQTGRNLIFITPFVKMIEEGILSGTVSAVKGSAQLMALFTALLFESASISAERLQRIAERNNRFGSREIVLSVPRLLGRRSESNKGDSGID